MNMKCRIWDNQTNNWYEPTTKAYENNIEYLLVGVDGSLMMVKYNGRETNVAHESTFPDRFIVTYSTGIIGHKEEEEIYAGDIVKNIGLGIIYKVEFDKEFSAFMLRDIKTNKQYFMLGINRELTPHEIIGNIFANPELLTA